MNIKEGILNKVERLRTLMINILLKRRGIVYLVYLDRGDWEDYYVENIFTTTNKDKAEKWKAKFNRIIDNNWKRAISCGYGKTEPFWHDEIDLAYPVAQVKEVEWR